MLLLCLTLPSVCPSNLVCLAAEEEARFTKNLSNVEGTETDSVKLICEVSKPSADVTWYKEDRELPEGGRYEQIVDGKRRILLIQDLKMDDAGEYSCRLSPSIKTTGNLKINGTQTKICWSVFSLRLSLSYLQPLTPISELAAEFISRPQGQEVVEGEKAEFTCSVSKETFEVRWMKDDKELETGDKYQMIKDGKRRTLVIKNSELRDEGAYVVMIGATRASADLTVLGKPSPLIFYLSVCLFSSS